MAVSSIISSVRPRHRTARASSESFQGCLALDFANGLALASGAASATVGPFDSANDRVVSVASTALVWITIGAAPVAVAGGAGCMPIPAGQPVMLYVPANNLVASIGTASVSLIPALIASDP